MLSVRVYDDAADGNIHEPRAVQIGCTLPQPCEMRVIVWELHIARLMNNRGAEHADRGGTRESRQQQLARHVAAVGEVPTASTPAEIRAVADSHHRRNNFALPAAAARELWDRDLAEISPAKNRHALFFHKKMA